MTTRLVGMIALTALAACARRETAPTPVESRDAPEAVSAAPVATATPPPEVAPVTVEACIPLPANTWRRASVAPIGPLRAALAEWDGHEMLVTGFARDGGRVAAFYDPCTDRWQVTLPPTPPNPPGAERVRIVGADTLVLDEKTDTWGRFTIAGDVPFLRRAVLAGDRVVALEGKVDPNPGQVFVPLHVFVARLDLTARRPVDPAPPPRVTTAAPPPQPEPTPLAPSTCIPNDPAHGCPEGLACIMHGPAYLCRPRGSVPLR